MYLYFIFKYMQYFFFFLTCEVITMLHFALKLEENALTH